LYRIPKPAILNAREIVSATNGDERRVGMKGRRRRLAGAAVVVVMTATLVSAAFAAPGGLDPSFDGDGLVVTDFPSFALERANALVRQPDGKLVAAGSVGFVGSNSRFALARYNPDGSLDSSFDGDGRVVTDFPVSGSADANALVLQPDGRLVTAGGVGFIPSGFALARYNPDGSLDSSFDGDGRVVTGFPPVPLGPTFSPARALVLQPDGKLVAAGNTTGAGDCRFVLVRYNPDGSLDATFDGDGIAMATSSAGCQANALTLQPDGKLVAAGNVSTNLSGSERHMALARFNPNGSLDSTFDGDGIVVTNFLSSSLFDSANAVLAQPDGKLVAAGSIGSFDGFALARYNPDGSLDSTFDGDGQVITDSASFPFAGAKALVRQPDGKLVAAGFVFNDRFALARYNPDGSLDSSFDGDGRVVTDFPVSAQEFAAALLLQPDGKLVAAGGASVAGDGGFGGFALARYQGDCSLRHRLLRCLLSSRLSSPTSRQTLESRPAGR
jgi:uncharacterized delta-60 repeat protein